MSYRAVFLILLLVMAPPALQAQQSDGPRLRVGGHLTYARATGEFAEFVDDGFGVAGHAVLTTSPEAVLGLRLDLGFLQYGSERRRISFPGTGGLIQLDLDTSNNIFYGGIGPELGVPVGRGRLYGFGTIGLAHFATTSTLDGVNDDDEFGRTTNLSDGTFAWTGGAGAQIPVTGSAFPVVIDFGIVYHGNGDVTYLTEDGITDVGGGNIDIDPVRSETRLITYRIGVSVPVGGNR